MQADTLSTVALLVKTARWYEARAEHPGSIFVKRAKLLRIHAMKLLRTVRGYRLTTQMEFDYD